MDNIIFVGSVYPDKLYDELLRLNAHIDFAAHTFQSALLAGLDEYTTVRVISSPVIRMERRVKKGFDSYYFSHLGAGEEKDVYVGTKNGILLKVYEFFQVRKFLKKYIEEYHDASILVYALHSPFLLALCTLKNIRGKACVVVPDLPEHMSDNKSLMYKLAKKIDKCLIDFCLKRIEGFVLFSPYMKNLLPIGKKPWIQVEGIYRANPKASNIEKAGCKTVLYTGGIDSRYGVFDLIEAFTLIEQEDYELWLCGGCSEKRKLEHYLASDPRIKYFGMVDKNKVSDLQRQASLLVNPRHSTEEFTKYSFPSKTMEYLASGTPTLMCKLPAMPDEYLPYVYLFKDESVNGYKQSIIEVLSKPKDELIQKGEKASNFILSQKNEKIQSKKIINLLNVIKK